MTRALRVARRAGGATRVALQAMLGARRTHDLPTRAWRLHQAMADLARVQGLALDVRGVVPSSPAILVANHVGYLDGVAIGALVPCTPIAKGEVASWPLVGGAMDSVGVTFVDRSSVWSGARTLRRALAALRAGVSVLNFPEGTTTDGSHLRPFRRGVFGLARLAGVPIIPIALRFDPASLAWFGDARFLPHYVATAARERSSVRIAFGTPIAADAATSADGLARLTQQRISHLLEVPTESHAPVLRRRLPAPRPDTVLPAARRRSAAGQ